MHAQSVDEIYSKHGSEMRTDVRTTTVNDRYQVCKHNYPPLSYARFNECKCYALVHIHSPTYMYIMVNAFIVHFQYLQVL